MAMVGIGSERAVHGAISVGAVLSQLFATVRRHLVPYVLLALVLTVLNLSALAKPYMAPAAYQPFNIVVVALRAVTATVLQAGMTVATARALAGEPFSATGGIAVGLRRFLPYLGAAILYILALMLGMILLVVPGLIALAALSLAPAASVIESTGPLASLRRSRALTRGNRWRVLAVELVVYVVPTLLFVAIGAGSVILHATSAAQVLRQQIIVASANLVLTPIYFALSAVLYHHLRRAEGNGLGNVAEVFA